MFTSFTVSFRRDRGGYCAIMLRNPCCRRSACLIVYLPRLFTHYWEEGGWTVLFRNIHPLIFRRRLTVGLANTGAGTTCPAPVLVSSLTCWNYFINAMGMTWGATFSASIFGRPGR